MLVDAGWDFDCDGLIGVPRVMVLVGEDWYGMVDFVLCYFGLGVLVLVVVDD